MIKNALILFTLVVNIFYRLGSAFPCSCAPPGTPREELEKSDAVFKGTVLELKVDTLRVQNAAILFFKVKFEVLAAWKGVDLGEITLATNFESAACGFPFEQGVDYLVYAFSQNDSLSTNLCTRTKKLSEAQADLNELGTPVIVSVSEPDNIPETPRLWQNYPNPFNPTTQISFSIPNSTHVKVIVYDLLGREIQTLVDEMKPAGEHSVTFDANRLASGLYFYKLQVGNSSTGLKRNLVEVKKMLFLR